MEEKVIETKSCRQCSASFDITDKDSEFYDKISPIFGGAKYPIPSPTLCPDCRQQRRLLWRNERKLYKRKCDLTGKSIISVYSQDHPYVVYDEKARRGDGRDPMEYGFEFDFTKPFFDQFDTLMKKVPQANRMNFSNENSEYVNYMNDSKNCYLDFGSGFLEDCCYCNRTYQGKNLFDCGYCYRGENSYMCIKCENFYHCMYCQSSKDITDCNYCFDCENCTFCTGCVGLRGQQYCILNKKYNKEDYQKQLADIGILSDDTDFIQQYTKLKDTHPRNAMNITSSENCSGNDIKNSKNAIICYEVDAIQDCKYCREVMEQKDLMDVNNNGWSQLMYDTIGFGYSNKLVFTMYCAESSNLSYCAYCQHSQNLFGCVGLKHKEYCIFNKQYTREEYEKLVPQIIEHMITTGERGEFFPITMNYFGYNETVAHEYYPLTKETALSQGFRRQDKEYPVNVPDGIPIIQSNQLTNITSDEELLQSAIQCAVSGKPFRIVKLELDFYRKNNLPLPTKHPDIRHAERMALRNPRKLRDRTCMKCGIAIQTSYSPDSAKDGVNRPEIVYCENCYNKEIYG